MILAWDRTSEGSGRLGGGEHFQSGKGPDTEVQDQAAVAARGAGGVPDGAAVAAGGAGGVPDGAAVASGGAGGSEGSDTEVQDQAIFTDYDGQASDGGKRRSEGDEVPHDDGEAGTESYDPVAAAREDRDAAIRGLREIIELLQKEQAALPKESAETGEILGQALQLLEQHQADYQQLIALLKEMFQRGPNQGPDLGCQAASKARALKEETKRAKKRWPGRVWDEIWDKLKTILPRIWSMISRLLAVKEWTVSGQAGDLFGLAQVGISITFG